MYNEEGAPCQYFLLIYTSLVISKWRNPMRLNKDMMDVNQLFQMQSHPLKPLPNPQRKMERKKERNYINDQSRPMELELHPTKIEMS
jgi:hypothetical protein